MRVVDRGGLKEVDLDMILERRDKNDVAVLGSYGCAPLPFFDELRPDLSNRQIRLPQMDRRRLVTGKFVRLSLVLAVGKARLVEGGADPLRQTAGGQRYPKYVFQKPAKGCHSGTFCLEHLVANQIPVQVSFPQTTTVESRSFPGDMLGSHLFFSVPGHPWPCPTLRNVVGNSKSQRFFAAF